MIMSWPLKRPVGYFAAGMSPFAFLTACSTIRKNAPYISHSKASKLLSLPNRAEADARWTYHTERDYDFEDSLNEQTVLCLPYYHHT